MKDYQDPYRRGADQSSAPTPRPRSQGVSGLDLSGAMRIDVEKIDAVGLNCR